MELAACGADDNLVARSHRNGTAVRLQRINSDRRARCHIPDAEGVVPAGRDGAVPVGRERHAGNDVGVSFECAEAL